MLNERANSRPAGCFLITFQVFCTDSDAQRSKMHDLQDEKHQTCRRLRPHYVVSINMVQKYSSFCCNPSQASIACLGPGSLDGHQQNKGLRQNMPSDDRLSRQSAICCSCKSMCHDLDAYTPHVLIRVLRDCLSPIDDDDDSTALSSARSRHFASLEMAE